MIKCSDIRAHIIPTALTSVGLYSRDVGELLICTMAQETIGGTYLSQTNGPAVGIYEMEPKTYTDLLGWAGRQTNNAAESAIHLIGQPTSKYCACSFEDMIGNLYYATIMARLFYLRAEIQDKVTIPAHTDINGLWGMYKKYWNTMAGKATQEEFLHNYNNYVKT
jgi:hypothetical protein